ncbi:MAG: MBL fold metallo-hydrolase [Thermoanaerobaculia bacterium]|nr:MBL fold metallo-hydrolase [Thermoanaerobaculia bacterium]
MCSSEDPRNRRLRPGLKIELDERIVLVDTPTDLRQQALLFGLPRVDAVLFTHHHADHIFGLDEVRVFNFRQGSDIPCYGSLETLNAIRRTFAYAFESGQEGGGKPRLELIPLDPEGGGFPLLGREIVPVPVFHGSMPVLGYRFGPFAYVTDCNRIPEESFRLLDGVEVLILGALRYRSHSTHFSIPEAVETARRIGADRTIFTHISHEVDHGDLRPPLPAPGIELGYDGMRIHV